MENMSLFEQSYIKGTISRLMFQNADNFYTVLKVEVLESNEDFEDEATVIGYLPQVAEGDTYTFTGKVVTHAKYGKQLSAEKFEKDMPQTRDGIIHYLSSDLFKGIGKKLAQQIVDTLGEDALTLIMNDRNVLKKVPKLSKEKQEMIYQTVNENQAIEKTMIRLNEWGFGPQLAMKIFQFYKEETLPVIEKSPYQLVMDIQGIGFSKADELARKLGIEGNHPERLRAALVFTLEQACLQNGHTYIEEQSLLEAAYTMLTASGEQVDSGLLVNKLTELSEEKVVVSDRERIYMPSLYYAEIKTVQVLHRLKQTQDKIKQFEQSEIMLAIGELESSFEVTYADKQREALETAMSEKMMILSGGPGTGKTTVIRGIVNLYAELHGLSLDYKDYEGTDFPVAVAAPTGRASKRLSESTGLEATTIHRLIGWTRENKPDDILENDIAAKLVIIDEMSMVDTWLMFQLMRAVPNDCQIIFVGDQDQLPSVGPGQVFRDLIDSGIMSQVELAEVYRQQEGSSIIELAHQIKRGQSFDIAARYNDRSFLPCSTDQIPTVINQVVSKAVDKGYDMRDIQVLAPIYKGKAGIRFLNKELQQILNPQSDDKRELEFGDIIYRDGDKVLQLVNRPEDNVFNGDIGEVVGIFMAAENALNKDVVIVDYEGNEVTYTKQDLTELTHAYCCSIHKSQGSEFPIVIMPVVRAYYRMLQKNILYTGLTRAKQSLIICGERSAFDDGIKRMGLERHTSFREHLQEYFGMKEEKQAATTIAIGELTEENMHQISPMINMEGISPSDYETVDD
ncbi:ATP-dependent RecD-like DNA helicase [Macrococcus hajekii]|uniref:ATP-dependent RecD2 DNA helicase n=1 Tax=Macrococcus hajekii TaxID=198482 RepID=A0A4R6BM02_9STAP|nr:ATP-dependent RecD-like DNA helicase [Macrococcus hajekii]TDM02839.1 ATP-dependent RecD-like DNA helicase [Macrococcus hajekii]GGB04303.1 ATP-dependent RecD-like DNA helicase [Macrococcus hajekii]